MPRPDWMKGIARYDAMVVTGVLTFDPHGGLCVDGIPYTVCPFCQSFQWNPMCPDGTCDTAVCVNGHTFTVGIDCERTGDVPQDHDGDS